MAETGSSISAVLRQRARERPDALAYTYIDYDVDPDGVTYDLTWSQVHQRAQVVAAELASCGSPGDRVALCAPQGLEYIIGFLGAIEAGFTAVPLSPPQFGAERVAGALRDSSPTAVLTTSAVVDDVDSTTRTLPGSPPTVIEIDALDLYGPPAVTAAEPSRNTMAMLQYTSGSTRQPTGVTISHRNLAANFEQTVTDFFDGEFVPPDTTVVSWLPFYHDMGLMLAMREPIMFGIRSVLTSPIAFLQRPARWMQLLAANTRAFSAAPNFAFELAVRKTSDDDLAGLDLGGVLGILSGSERIHPATLKRFTERFARFNFPEQALRPSYGLAEATCYVATRQSGGAPHIVQFNSEKLSVGYAERGDEGGTPLVSYGAPRSQLVRIVDPETRTENPAGKVGEIWVHGEHVSGGYWRQPQLSEQTFGAQLVDPAPGTPQRPWLRTGDLGVISDGELFVIGRIKDVLIVDGRNHYPDDIEATIQEITGGRVAAIPVSDDVGSEQLVVVIELKQRGSSDDEIRERFSTVKRQVRSAISKLHGLPAADLVLVSPGTIPITTSGKVRRSACADLYRRNGFARLDRTG